MPTNHGLGANDMECLAPPGPPPREPHPEGAVEGPEPRSLRAVAEQGELLPERQVFKREISVGPERSTRAPRRASTRDTALQRRSASSRRPVSLSSLANDSWQT